MLKEHIDSYYKKRNVEKDRKGFYATDSGQCPRRIYFSFKKYPKLEVEPRILRVFHNGDFVHTRLGGALVEEGVIKSEKDIEVPIPENDLIRGRADAIVEINGEKVVVDFKSVNGVKFRTLEAPEIEHVKQVMIYMHFFNIKKGLLVYECKNTQDIKEFEIKYDENLVKEILEFFRVLRYQIENNQIPDVPDWVEQWRCDYCPYLEECKKIGNPYYS